MARTHLVSSFRRGIASRHDNSSWLSGRLACESGMLFRGSELQLRHNVRPSIGALAPEEILFDFLRTLVRFSKTSAK